MNFLSFGKRLPQMPEIAPPAGRIQTRGELQDLVIEARKERKAIRIYLVSQAGNMNEFFLTSRSRLEKPDPNGGICSDDNFYRVNGRELSKFGCAKHPKDRYYRTDILCGSYNIGCTAIGRSPHYAFTNRLHAQRYSLFLKTHREYMQYVKDWHAYCASAFPAF